MDLETIARAAVGRQQATPPCAITRGSSHRGLRPSPSTRKAARRWKWPNLPPRVFLRWRDPQRSAGRAPPASPSPAENSLWLRANIGPGHEHPLAGGGGGGGLVQRAPIVRMFGPTLGNRGAGRAVFCRGPSSRSNAAGPLMRFRRRMKRPAPILAKLTPLALRLAEAKFRGAHQPPCSTVCKPSAKWWRATE